MNTTAYFDTNVFDHLMNKKYGLTVIDEKTLVSAVKSGKISIPLSLLNLEEALCAWENYPDEASRKIKFILDLADWGKMIKPQDKLLTNDIKSYVRGSSINQPFFEDPNIHSGLKELRNPTKNNMSKFIGMIKKIKEEKTQFKDENINCRKVLRSIINELERVPTFEEYWEKFAIEFTKSLIEGAGLIEEFKYRNVNGLLEVRSVRLWVGYSISYIYGQGFKKLIPDLGDSRDMKHAVSASAANIFVTNDGDLLKLMRRVPINDFEVLDIYGLLDRIH